MPEKPNKEPGCNHQCGCGCTPTLFVDMIEKAGLALSRRDFIKGTTAMGGLAAPMKIRDIQVLETIKDGQTIFSA